MNNIEIYQIIFVFLFICAFGYWLYWMHKVDKEAEKYLK